MFGLAPVYLALALLTLLFGVERACACAHGVHAPESDDGDDYGAGDECCFHAGNFVAWRRERVEDA